MKTIFTLLLTLFFVGAYASDIVFVHTTTGANTSGHITTIDHPVLNGNPGAIFIFTHNLDGPASGVQYNNNIDGTWYDGSNWTIYNEDISPMTIGAAFNIYVPDGGNMFTIQADGTSYDFEIDNAAINGNPNAAIVSSHIYNPSGVYNIFNYGFWYDTVSDRWHLYNEATVTNIPANAAFNVLIDDGAGGGSSFVYDAVTTSGGNYTVMSHPDLDGLPDAYPVVTHNWGSSGDPSNIIMDVVLGVWYNGTNWTIYTEDTSVMPVDTRYNVYVANPGLGVSDNVALDVSTFPNPANNEVTFLAKQEINNVALYNILGQEVRNVSSSNTSVTLDIANLASGQYIAKVQAGDATKAIKVIKE
ncbi:T9SS type A sorting domain-containing protein [Ulvibacter antarcticus]|uniref:Putative secreted protein (Por secretion system target) n=1 Tax=Ulvibacter antarcticus TaxID=442714 RepID=A0A3L9YDZ8_9FLAO|nr:T9SS type A sorting domain-containing protein [Ulvibacter antarcticus]RMA57657.1 putative secreted protein (Por secretion system target) [Ulvibacter antarcticus]